MAETVVMPKAGISVESCIIGEWRKKVGETVSAGDILFDYETDKAVFECESTASGTLLHVLFASGDEVPVLQAVCIIGQDGEDITNLLSSAAEESVTSEKDERSGDTVAADESNRISSVIYTDNSAVASGISPRARTLAHRLQLQTKELVGTGPKGRIIERDVMAMTTFPDQKSHEQQAQSAVITDKSVEPKAAYTDAKLTRIRQSIAKAMYASLQNTAQVTNHHSFDATALFALRSQCKKSGEQMGVSGITLGDMVLYATVQTLLQHPEMNALLLPNDIVRTFSSVHLGVAVDTERGLMVPTVVEAEKLSLRQLSNKVRELVAMCRSGSINPDLLQGGTFTVSNLGSLGVEVFTPILNPPQIGILGVCSAIERLRKGENGIESYPAMGLSLTYDHRVVDGAPASRFLRDLTRNLENIPLLLTL